MKVGDNINGDPLQPGALAMIRCIYECGVIHERQRARQAQADRIASLTQEEALQLVVLRRQGYGAVEAVEFIINARGGHEGAP